MESKGGVRFRKSVPPGSGPQEPRDEERNFATKSAGDPQPRSWRFYVRWVARITIPIVLILANARVVRIPAPDRFPIPRSSAVLVIAHSRAAYLERCLSSILSHHPGSRNWPVIISMDRQDGEPHADVAEIVSRAVEKGSALGIELYPWAHEQSYEQDVENGSGFVDSLAYRRISRHYEWALSRVFAEGILEYPVLDRVVIVEDDMEVSSDFFAYFTALAPLLHEDDSLFCVSAWNDNGIESLALNHSQFHRTDFFPGLGWMLSRQLWEELQPKWPKMFWDDWMRKEEQRRGRQCIRPEVSRTANFGKVGVSQSFQFEKHVSKVVLARKAADFASLNLSYLGQEEYHHYIFSRMSNAVQLKYSNYLTSKPQDADVIAFYPDEHLDAIGKRTGIMADDRDGLRRTSYKGVIVFPWNGHWAFVVQRGWDPPEGYRLGARECC